MNQKKSKQFKNLTRYRNSCNAWNKIV